MKIYIRNFVKIIDIFDGEGNFFVFTHYGVWTYSERVPFFRDLNCSVTICLFSFLREINFSKKLLFALAKKNLK